MNIIERLVVKHIAGSDQTDAEVSSLLHLLIEAESVSDFCEIIQRSEKEIRLVESRKAEFETIISPFWETMTVSYICPNGHLTLIEVDKPESLCGQALCQDCGEIATWDKCSISKEVMEVMINDFTKHILRIDSNLDQANAELREILKKLDDPSISFDERIRLNERHEELSIAMKSVKTLLTSARRLLEAENDDLSSGVPSE